MKQLLYLGFRLVYAIKAWLSRRLTVAGRSVLAGMLGCAVLGIDTNRTMAYMGFTLLLAMLLTSAGWCLFFRPRITALRKLPRFATAGDPLSYSVVLENRGAWRQEGLYLLEDVESPLPTLFEVQQAPEPDGRKRNPFDRSIGYHRWTWLLSRKQVARSTEQPLAGLPSDEPQQLRLELLPLRRGRLRFKGLSLVCPDPLGLFKARAYLPGAASLLVLPRRYLLPPLQLPGARRYQPGGVSLASSVGDSEEFLSLRDYRPGDPLRRIHWKSWAKTGRPVVKEYQDEFFVRHALILDTFQRIEASEVLEEAVSVAASFVYTIQTQESLLDLMFIGTEAYCFTSGRGLAYVDRMIEILACVQACGDKPFPTLLPLVTERAPLLSGTICVLLAWDEERKALVSLLKKLGLPVLVLVITDRGDKETMDPGPMKDDPANFHCLRAGRIQEGLSRL
ncbi:MAG: DUF58 domain-containing protein [Thermodesulfobacteriota bacterium]